MIIQHNIAAMYADIQLKNAGKNKVRFGERLSTGYRINRAADDAASLTISEKMRAQIRGLDASKGNIADGKAYCNVADGALGQVHSILDRIKELAVQAASDTNTSADRTAMDEEVQQMKKEITSVLRNTEYNTINIWQAAYVPEVGGTCKDFSLYNVEDSSGSYYGGIIYMNHRYSWEDLGINNWDSTSHTFTSTTKFSIDATVLQNNGTSTLGDPSVNDDYISSHNSGAIFSIATTKDSAAVDIKKNYDWSADDTGIYIDNVMTTSMDPDSVEGNTTWAAMGLTAGQYVDGGTYTFKYYGMEVSFEVPPEGDAWPDFLGGINNTLVNIDWHSEYFNTYKAETVKCTNASQILIDNTNKDYISTSSTPYSVCADEDGIWIKNSGNMKTALDKDGTYGPSGSLVRWEDLSNPDGYDITSWGLDTDNNGSTNLNGPVNADGGDTKVTVSSNTVYTYEDDSLGSSFSFDFRILDEASRGAVIKDLNNSTFVSTGVVSPTCISSYTDGSSSSGAFLSSGLSSSISFVTQRNVFDRSFSSPTEAFAEGEVNESGGYFTLDLSKAGGGSTVCTMTSLESRSDLESEISKNISDKMKNMYYSAVLNAVPVTQLSNTADPNNALLHLGTYTVVFEQGLDTVRLNLDLSDIQYGDIISSADAAAGKTPDSTDFAALVGTYVSNNMDKFLDSKLTLSGDGTTYQKLSLQENSVKDNVAVNVPVVDGVDLTLTVQSGANANENIDITYDYLRLGTLGLKTTNVLTGEDASSAIQSVDKAIGKVSQQRSLFGAYTNRLEHAYSVNDTMSENLQTSESKIRDADMAQEMVNNLKSSVLEQVGQSILAQANHATENVLNLLQ